MSLHTHIQVYLDGTVFTKIVAFSLEEKVGEHAVFSVSLRGQAIENKFTGASLLERSKSFLGKPFFLEITETGRVDRAPLYFRGQITQVKGKKGDDHGGLGDLIKISGKSSSILLDDGPNLDSSVEKSLSEIVDDLARDYSSSESKIKIRPENDALLAYSVQHHQSTFGYLQYLAATQGEYLLYSVDTLYFGKPNLGEEVVLKYGVDLKDFSLGLTTEPLKFNYFSNDYTRESTKKASSEDIASTARGYTSFTSSISNQFFPKADNKQVFYGFESNRLQQQLDSAVALQKKLAEQKQVSLVGESTNMGVTLGKVVAIRSSDDSFGSYRVTQIKHTYKQGGNYKNTFTAVPTEIDVYPLTDIGLMQSSHPQVAKVVATNDPNGLSRIKVQFPWQAVYNKKTPWIRVATPYAGGDRGIHFLPEVNDEILVAFENGDVERPYMQSALYTGVNKHSAWQSENNDFKGITTKGGHVIELNDTAGGEMITITDKNGNKILIDTANNNMEISALENMTFNAKNIELNAQEEVNINAGTNMSTRVTEDISISAKNTTEMLEENKTLVAKEILGNAEKMRLESSKDNMELVSSKQVDIQANDKIKLF